MKRRPHWDDELIESLPIPGHSYLEDEDIYAIIAAVEDWQDANGFSRAGTLMHRLIDAEAAIQRVRGIPEKESDVGYPNDWHIGWNACRESVLDALEERGRDNDVLH